MKIDILICCTVLSRSRWAVMSDWPKIVSFVISSGSTITLQNSKNSDISETRSVGMAKNPEYN